MRTVKKGALIGTIFLIIGFIMEFMLFSNVFGGHSYADLILSVQGSFWGAFLVVPYVGMILVLLFSIGSKKVLMIIGSIISTLALLSQLVAWMSADEPIFNPLYWLGSFVLVLGMLFYFIGNIQYRKQSKLGLFTSLLLLLVVFISNIIIGFFLIRNGTIPVALGKTLSLYGALVQAFFFILHGFAYSFSKKKDDSWNDEDDTMSVESGDAFASYVPSGKTKKEKTKKDKKKKKSKGDKNDDDFIFDF